MVDSILVLLVEDEVMIREFVEASLEDAGMSVVTAGHGGDAISLLDSLDGAVKALVTDVRLGNGPDGWAITRYARKLRPHLPVVYFSGQNGADWPSEGVPNSVFIRKPFSGAQIAVAVRQAMASGASQH